MDRPMKIQKLPSIKRLPSYLRELKLLHNGGREVVSASLLAEKLGRASGYDDYSLFLCNSGAEAN